VVTGIVLAVVGFVLLLIGLGLSVPIVEQFENPVPSAQQRGCPWDRQVPAVRRLPGPTDKHKPSSYLRRSGSDSWLLGDHHHFSCSLPPTPMRRIPGL